MNGLFTLYSDMKDNLMRAFECALTEGCYIGGHYVEDFEMKMKDYLKCEEVIACKSGTHSLIIALLAAKIQPGDEVITVGTTYYATAYAIKAVGAKVVFCDVLANNGTMDPEAVIKCITPRTKAILPVHLYGIPSELSELHDICNLYGLEMVEDCSHCFGSKYNGKYIGAESRFACFSLYPTKNFGAFGDGGMITTNNSELAENMRRLRYFAQNNEHNKFDFLAVHGRCDTIQAALMIEVIDYFPELVKRRKHNEKLYFEKLNPGIKKLYSQSESIVPYVFPIYVRNRNFFMEFMKKKNVSLQIHFDVNLYELDEFCEGKTYKLINTRKHNSSVVSLPVIPIYGEEEINNIIRMVNEFAEEYPQYI